MFIGPPLPSSQKLSQKIGMHPCSWMWYKVRTQVDETNSMPTLMWRSHMFKNVGFEMEFGKPR